MMSYYKYYKLLLLSVVLTLSCQTISAQQLQASRIHLSTEDGLCSNAVSMICQDDLGFIWLATWNGLSRFDGYEFYNYKTGNSSHIKNLHNRILDIVIDQSQNVWMHMYDDRVFVLDRNTDQIINPFEGYDGFEEYRTNAPLLVTSSGEVLVSIAGNNSIYMMTLDRRGLKSEKITAGELSITSMAEGYQSDIWLGTNKGIHRLDRRSLSLERDAILPEQHISCLYSNGYNIFAATKNGSIYSFAYGQEPKLLRNPNGMGIFSTYVDSHGLVWFCDDRMGVSRLNPETGNEKFFQQTVLVPEQDGRGGEFNEHNGVVWIRMNHGGYGYYNRETDQVEYFHNDPSNPWNLSNTVNAALVIKEGVVWESTSRRGLEKLDILKDNIVRIRPVPDAVSTLENEIRALYYDKDRKVLMLGNKSSCIFMNYDNGRQEKITQDSQGNSFGRIYGISKDSKGNYWICSKDYGVFLMSPKANGGWDIKKFCYEEGNPQSLSDNAAYYAVEDKQGNIWIATYGGGVNLMIKDSRGGFIFQHPKNGMKNYPKNNTYLKVRTIEVDIEGNVWAGTTDGILIMRYEGKEVKIEKLKMPSEGDQVLMSNDIIILKRDNRGHMWVGSNGGGIAYSIGKDKDGNWLFENYGAKDGLPSEEIRSITFDQHGNAWFATEHIISTLDIEKKIFTTFSNLDGVDETMMSEGGAITLENDDILFGTINGYYVVDRSKLMAEKGSLLKLQITDFFVNGELQSPRFNDNYDFYAPMARRIKLPINSKSFGFRFAAMNYALQHRVHYQYMLEGYEEEWHNAERNRIATYDKLKAGTYTFKVKAFLLESPEKFDLRTVEVVVPAFTGYGQIIYWIIGFVVLAVLLWLLFRMRRKK
jgi:ligand-binding sensor domain-containing protein